MTTEAVLVLGPSADNRLTEALFDCGYAPLVRKTMRQTLDKLRQGRFAAVLVERGPAEDDMLEFVLNVRDIDGEIPVVIIGGGTDSPDDETLSRQHRVYLLTRPKSASQLAGQLKAVIAAALGRNRQASKRHPT